MSPRFPIFASSSEARTATLQSLLIAAIVITGLYVAREVLLPLALAILLSVVLTPALLFLRRLKIPRGVGVAIVVVFAFALIFGLGWLMSQQATQLAGDLPRYQHVLAEKISALRKIGGWFASPREGHRSYTRSRTRARQPDARA
jgi:predicted PurR-regulated permease PerM